LGKPLISHTIRQALSCPFVDRVMVDTDSSRIAKIARRFGAEVPFLRSLKLAEDASPVADSIFVFLLRLEKQYGYVPKYFMVLQTTSPLREMEDINRSWEMMRKNNATTVLTVCSTHPRLYHLDERNNLILANKKEKKSTNMQAWPAAYMLNGCFVYIVKTAAFKKERKIITQKTKAVVCDKWRSVDLDTMEDWVVAEILYKNKERIEKNIKKYEV